MAFIKTIATSRELLEDQLLNKNLVLHLYVNSLTASPLKVLDDFIELQGGNYKPIVLRSDKWTFKETKEMVTASYPTIKFVFSGKMPKIYGYYITENNIVKYYSTIDSGPMEVKKPGDVIRINLELKT